MKHEAELGRRLRSLLALGAAVGAMKSLSAHHFREARGAVDPARSYREGVNLILGRAGVTVGAGDGPAGLLIVGGELGLCGGYNARVVEAGARCRLNLGEGPTFCVGRRATALLKRRDVDVEATYGAPTSVRGITSVLLRLAEDVLTTYVARRLSSFDILSSRFAGVGVAAPTTVRLLPFGPRREEAARPARYVSPGHFASAAIREFLYITLYDLLLDALASEHGARLVATQSAQQWLDERTDRLRRHLAATRREAGTQEVIEIAAGARMRGVGS